MSSDVFIPTGPSITFLAATTAPIAVQIISNITPQDWLGLVQYRILNSFNDDVYLGWGHIAGTAQTMAAGTAGIPLLAGSMNTIGLPARIFFTGRAVGGSIAPSQVYITPGGSV